MEEPKNKQGKRRAHIVVKGGGHGGGGNIGGLVVWGGVLVVGGLIAAFAVKKRRQGSTCDKKNCNKKGGSKQEVGSTLQTKSASSQLNPCCSDTNQGSTMVVESQVDRYAKDLILDRNPTSTINGVTQDHSNDHQHIDDSAKESIPLSVECRDAYEFSFPVVDVSLLSKVGNGIKKNSGEDYMNRTQVIKEERVVGDVKIIAQGMSKVQIVDAANDHTETGKSEKEVDAEKTTEEISQIHSAVDMEKVVDAEIATSSTNSDDSEEDEIKVKEEAGDAEWTIVKKFPTSQASSADDTENSHENLAPVENPYVMKVREMVNTSYAVATSYLPLNFVSDDKNDRDGSTMKENNEVKNGSYLANDERVKAETDSSMHLVGVAVDHEEIDVKDDPVENLQPMETNDGSKHKVSLACSVEEEDESDGYVNNEDNEHESYTSDGGEDSSEGTETSSTESNSAKIWSVESLEKDLNDSAKKITENEGQSVVNSASLDNSKNSSSSVTLKSEVPSLLAKNRRAHLTKWRSWGLSIPALSLLLLLLIVLQQALFPDLLYRSFFVPSNSEN